MTAHDSPVRYTYLSQRVPGPSAPSGYTSRSGRPISSPRAGMSRRNASSAASNTNAGPRRTAMPGPVGNLRLAKCVPPGSEFVPEYAGGATRRRLGWCVGATER